MAKPRNNKKRQRKETILYQPEIDNLHTHTRRRHQQIQKYDNATMDIKPPIRPPKRMVLKRNSLNIAASKVYRVKSVKTDDLITLKRQMDFQDYGFSSPTSEKEICIRNKKKKE